MLASHLLAVILDIFSRWTNEVYGCDVRYEEGEKPQVSSFTVIVIINLVVMLLCYGLVLWKVHTTKDEEDQPMATPASHTSMVCILSVTYAFCTLPVVVVGRWNQVCFQSRVIIILLHCKNQMFHIVTRH